MKKLISALLTFSLILSFFSFSYISIYAESKLVLVNPTDEEKGYIDELQRIQDELYIAGTSALKTVSDKSSKEDINKNLAYIKTQIKDLRIKLDEYHKKESPDIDRNPISLGLLNTLNYYSMALSALEGFVNSGIPSDQNRYLENYYFAKASATQTFDWVKDALGY